VSTLYCPTCLTTFEKGGERCTNLSCGRKRPEPEGWGVLLGEGDLLDRHYRIDRPLAVGGAGLTYLAREVDLEGRAQPPDLAIKVLYAARASGAFLHRLSTEAQILQELDHDHIVQLRGFVHRSGQEPYLVTLFEHGGNLTQLVEENGPLPVWVAAAILWQILRALDVAHQRGVVHRDLKPDNVLLRERVDPDAASPEDAVPHVRVADFGIAKVVGAMGKVTKHGSFVGTPEYAAPEQFDGQDPTPATDVFAAGALLRFLVTARPPIVFSARTDIDQCRLEWLEALPPTLDGEPIRGDAVEIELLEAALAKLMDPRPDRRWTVQEALSHLDRLADGRSSGGVSDPSQLDGGFQPKHRDGTLELTGRPAPQRSEEPDSASLDRPPSDEAVAARTEPYTVEPPRRTGASETLWEVHDGPPPVPGEDPDDVSTERNPPPPPLENDPPPPPDPPDPPAESRPEASGEARVSEPLVAEPPAAGSDPPEPDPPEPHSRPAPTPGAAMTTPEPVPSEASGGGSGCVAVLAGLGVAGGAVLGIAAVAVLLVLGGLAWQLGYFSGPVADGVVLDVDRPAPEPDAPEPVPGPDPDDREPVQPPDPDDPEPDPDPQTPGPDTPAPDAPEPVAPAPGTPIPSGMEPLEAGGPGWKAVLAALDGQRPVVESCGVDGILVGTAWVEGGRVTTVRADRGYGPADALGCAAGKLEGTVVSDAGVTGWMRFGI
jgi:serine/threonine-protein kinase